MWSYVSSFFPNSTVTNDATTNVSDVYDQLRNPGRAARASLDRAREGYKQFLQAREKEYEQGRRENDADRERRQKERERQYYAAQQARLNELERRRQLRQTPPPPQRNAERQPNMSFAAGVPPTRSPFSQFASANKTNRNHVNDDESDEMFARMREQEYARTKRQREQAYDAEIRRKEAHRRAREQQEQQQEQQWYQQQQEQQWYQQQEEEQQQQQEQQQEQQWYQQQGRQQQQDDARQRQQWYQQQERQQQADLEDEAATEREMAEFAHLDEVNQTEIRAKIKERLARQRREREEEELRRAHEQNGQSYHHRDQTPPPQPQQPMYESKCSRRPKTPVSACPENLRPAIITKLDLSRGAEVDAIDDQDRCVKAFVHSDKFKLLLSDHVPTDGDELCVGLTKVSRDFEGVPRTFIREARFPSNG